MPGSVPSRIRSLSLRAAIVAVAGLVLGAIISAAHADDLKFPQIIKLRYEAADQRVGGHFTIWLDRDRLFHGLDAKLYPPVKYVEVTHITPAPGSPMISMIEIMSINAAIPEYYHVGGFVRLKVSNMLLKSTNMR